MNFNDYQAEAVKTAVYPKDKAMEYLLGGLAVEAAEALELYVKALRDSNGAFNLSKMGGELGDVLWFVALVADELGMELSLVAKNNLIKLKDRHERGVIHGSGDNR